MTPTAQECADVDLSHHPVWAVTMVKDEADVIEGVLRHMAGEGVAGIIVADNGSTDGTRDILDHLSPWRDARGEEYRNPLGCPVVVIDDDEVAYYQAEKMTRLASLAAEGYGAEWVIPFDADELWLAPHHIARWLGAQPDHVNVVEAGLYHHLRTAVDVEDDDPFRSMVWRQVAPAGLPKVAVRWRKGATLQAGNHGVDYPVSRVVADGLSVRHFPYRSPEQMTRKAKNGAAAYAATDLPEMIGAHWRQYGLLMERHGDDIMAEVFREHFWYLAPTESGLIRDPAGYRRWESA